MSTPLSNYLFTTFVTPDGEPTVQLGLSSITGLEDDGSGTAHICLSRFICVNADELYSWFHKRDPRLVTVNVTGGVAVTVYGAVPERYTVSNLDAGANQKWVETLHICGNIQMLF